MAPWIPEYDDTVVHIHDDEEEEAAVVLSGDDPKTSVAPLHESSSSSSSFRAASRIQNRSRDDNGSLREGRQSVSFGATDDDDDDDDDVVVHAVLHRNDYTDSERADSWYDRFDLREMKARADADARACCTGDDGRMPPQPPPRGLENRTRDGKRRRCLRVLGAYHAVRKAGDDEEAIAAACFRISAPRVIEAQVTGWRDEIAAWGAVLPRRPQRRRPPRTAIPAATTTDEERRRGWCSKSLHRRWAPGMHHTRIVAAAAAAAAGPGGE